MIRRISAYCILLLFSAASCGSGSSSAAGGSNEGSPVGLDEAVSLAASGSPSDLLGMGRRGGDGAWFALAEAASRAGHPDLARDLRIRSAGKDPAPFGTRSLASLLAEDPRALPRPLRALRRAERESGPDEGLRRARIAVLADLGRDRALVRKYGDFSGRGWEAPVLAAFLRKDGESPEAAAVLERFVLHCDDPSALSLLPPSAAGMLDEGPSRLLAARTAFAEGAAEVALTGYRDWLDSAKGAAACEIEDVSPVFAEMAAAAEETGRETEWALLLEEASGSLSGSKRYAAAYRAGLLRRSAGEPRAAAAAFLAASEAVGAGLERDRAVWYRLRTLYEDPSFAADEEVAAVSLAAGSWDNPERFGDVMEEFLHRRVLLGQWGLLERLYAEWGARWPSSERSRAALILAFASLEGRIPGSVAPEEYLERAVDVDPLSWPGLRAAGLLGRVPPVLEAASAESAGEAGGGAGTGADMDDEDAVLSLYLDWGLVESAYDAVMASPGAYSDSLIRRTSRALAEIDPRRSIRVAGILFARDGFVPDREALLLVHPLPYGDEAARAAEAEGLPPEIFHGLIRTESAWDASAVSRSGAMGLAQFMPATWEEWTRRLGYPPDADPTDPETNILFGAAYLEWLAEREWTGGWAEVLASYNAGGGRVRTWRRERPGVGEDLFAAGIPVHEPRAYVGKVLSAATLYGYLYDGVPPGDLHRRWGLPMPPMGEEVQ